MDDKTPKRVINDGIVISTLTLSALLGLSNEELKHDCDVLYPEKVKGWTRTTRQIGLNTIFYDLPIKPALSLMNNYEW